MNIDALKSRLQALQNPKGGGNKEQNKTLWRPTVGKHSVRILPSAYDKSNPFKEVLIYYGINNKTMISPVNFGEKDPIVEFTQKLRKSGNKEDWQLAKKLESKMRVFVPVIVRGEEDKGVRLWEFGKQVFMELLAIAEDEDVGDYTDVMSGRDITIETTAPETNGTNYNQSKVRVRGKSTPLSDNAAQVKDWLSNQPNPLDQFKKYTYEEMKSALQSHLTPEEETETPTVKESDEDSTVGDLPWEKTEEQKPKKSYSLSTKKTDVDKEIDDLFKI